MAGQRTEQGSDPTIAALASPAGTGGVAVVRVSGAGALAVAARVFRGRGFPKPSDSAAKPESHRAVYGILFSPTNQQPPEPKELEPIDQVLALPLLAPHSYTGEDTVEFFCHGGSVVAGQVVEACLQAGAQPAGPGEFTRRAFLNGKLSLDQAEAVADLIHAESRLAARAAVRQVLGGLDDQLRAIEGPLLELLARVEGSLEFAEEEDVTVTPREIGDVLRAADEAIAALLDLGAAGRLLRNGIQVALVGAPNAGKSSLLNALAGEDRAIVDDEPGTTRDVVTARVVRDGKVFVLHDTAGLREEAGRIERKGIDRTKRAMSEADIILHLDPAPAPAFAAAEIPNDTEAVVVRVATKIDRVEGAVDAAGALPVSNVTGEGIDRVWSAIDTAVAEFELQEAAALGVVLNRRHVGKLEECREELAHLARETEAGPEIVGTLLSSITARLGEVSGRVFSEQVLETIFRRFCVGK